MTKAALFERLLNFIYLLPLSVMVLLVDDKL